MKQDKILNVAIVGGGRGCKAVMDIIFAEKLSQLRMKLIGVACTNPEAVGYRYARERGIYTTRDYRDLYKLKDLNMIIELTGREGVANEIARSKPDHVRIMENVAARLFWDIFQIEEERIAERRRAEETLRESEAKYSKLVENSLTGIYIDQDEKVVLANNTFAEIYKYPMEELIGIDSWKLVHPEDRDLTNKIRTSRLKGEDAPSEYEARSLTRDGETIWIKRRNTRIEYKGRPAILGNIVDVTDRKQAEDALQHACNGLEVRVEERTAELLRTNVLLEQKMAECKRMEAALRETRDYLEKLINYANAPIIVWDPEGRVTLFNRAFEHLTGYAANETISQEVGMLFPEGRRDESLERIAATLSGEYWKSVEIPIRCKDGSIRTALWNSANIYAEDGKTLLATIAQGTDVTERKRAEEAVQESEERYRTLFEESRDAIYMTARDGRFVDVNQSSLDLFGYTRKEMIGLDIKEICVISDDMYRFEQEIEQKESVRDFEIKFRKKNGKQMDCLLTATLRRANDGSIIRKQGIIRDMTERKRLEAQLQQAQKMEALGRLAAGVAHEMNNPLTIILTSAMLIQEDIDRDDPNFQGLETITNETVRCRNIVSSLLDFARQTRSVKGEHQINDIVIESMRLTQKKAAFKDVALTHHLSEDIPIISVDKNQILQSLVNLALNAIEATHPGGRVTVTTTFLPLDELIEVAISDTGKGIAKDKIDKIFDPFFTAKEGGTGLGLSITRGIIEQHGGTIDVKSKPGHGTTFTIRLPINKRQNNTKAR